MKFHELAPSPNNTKIRMALRFKGIDFESIPVNPFDRESLLKLSGQDGSPVIEHQGMILPDSEAILHYLDANFPDAPRLYPRLLADRRNCDRWKAELDRRVALPWTDIFLYSIKRKSELDPATVESFLKGLAWLEETLGDADTFHGEDRPICDLRVAQWTTYALPGEGFLKRVRIISRFARLVKLTDEDFPRLRTFLAPWNARLA